MFQGVRKQCVVHQDFVTPRGAGDGKTRIGTSQLGPSSEVTAFKQRL